MPGVVGLVVWGRRKNGHPVCVSSNPAGLPDSRRGNSRSYRGKPAPQALPGASRRHRRGRPKLMARTSTLRRTPQQRRRQQETRWLTFASLVTVSNSSRRVALPPERETTRPLCSRSTQQQIRHRNHEHRQQRRGNHAADHRCGDSLHHFGTGAFTPHDR